MPDIQFKEIDPNIRKKKNCHYQDKIKDLISRIERDGNLATWREIGRTVKGNKYNVDKNLEEFYDLDDQFIDDGEAICQDSMSMIQS